MSNVKNFVWFTKASWKYLRGTSRADFVLGFLPAWRRFSAACAQDRRAEAERVAS